MNKKEVFTKYKRLIGPFLFAANRMKIRIRKSGSNNTITGLSQVRANKASIRICGNNNRVILGEMTTLDHCRITIEGDNNRVEIGKRNYLLDCVLVCEDANNSIITGEHTYIHNDTQLAATEGKSICLGDDCLLSSGINIRTDDSHVIFEAGGKKRINMAGDVVIGNHVWIGNKTIILKGSNIGDDTIIGTLSLVTHALSCPMNCIVAGNPAKVVKEGVNWYADRRTFGEE